MKKRLAEIEKRMSEIKGLLDTPDADLDALEKETKDLGEERSALLKKIEQRAGILAGIAAGTLPTKPIDTDPKPGAEPGQETRAEKFAKEHRMSITAGETRAALTVSGGTVATPTGVGELNAAMNTVSSIVDMVNTVDCTGMGSNKVPYEIPNTDEAEENDEGSVPTEQEQQFGYVTLTPSNFATIGYISKEIRKQSPINYESRVRESAYNRLRRTVARKITNAVYDSTLKNEITSITAIDAKTLRTIAYNHGTDDSIIGEAVLFLNKSDLIAFGDVRGTNEKKAVYEITPDAQNPNTGIIKDGGLSVRYCLNSACTALTGATNSSTTKTKPTMFYGQPRTIEVDLFGSYNVETNEGYKFGEGLLTIRGDVDAAADLTTYHGMTVVSLPKKSA